MELEQLVVKLRGGDKTVVNQIIEYHLTRVKQVAAKVAATYRKDREEVISVAILSLVEAANRAQDALYDNNITSYLIDNIKKDCVLFCKTDKVFGLSLFLYKQNKYFAPQRRVYDEDDETLSRTHHFPVELSDFLQSIDFSPVEKEVIKMRLKGYTDFEIGAFLRLSRERIRQIRQIISGKLLDNGLFEERRSQYVIAA